MKPALLMFCLFMSAALAQTPPTPKPVTVPVTLDHNRIIIDVRFPLPDGTTKRVRGWVDNGNPELSITADLAKKLGLEVSHEPSAGNGQTAPAPSVLLVGGMALHADGRAQVVDQDSIAPGSSAEINLPSTLLRNYDVIVDYFNRELTLGPPGTVTFKGTAAKATVNPDNGLLQLPAKIANETVNLALDVGSPFGLISPDLMGKFPKAWPRMPGAIGSANFWGTADEAQRELARVPSMQFGGIELAEVGMEAFPKQYMDWFQKRAGIPTAGLIGANALLNYRVGIDYAHNTVYFEQTSKHRPPDLDVVGVVLRPEPDGRYTIIGVADYQGKPSVPEVKDGDTLVAIDKVPAKGGTMGQAWSLLGGSPSDTRTLTIERDGKQFTVQATVRHFLAAPENPAGTHK